MYDKIHYKKKKECMSIKKKKTKKKKKHFLYNQFTLALLLRDLFSYECFQKGHVTFSLHLCDFVVCFNFRDKQRWEM